jgi:hypothetical protein
MGSKRSKTPDLMGDLLAGPKKQQPAAGPSPGAATEKKDKPAKMASTYYLSPEIFHRLEMAKVQAKMMLADEPGAGSISKSLIIEAALFLALDELDSGGAESSLARMIKLLMLKE